MKFFRAAKPGPQGTSRVYYFADHVLDVDRGSLSNNDDGRLPLRPKSFEVLTYLVENPGRLVSKEELLSAVWQGVVVTQDSLTQCLVDIRKVLGDSGRRIIRTVPRKGYLLDVEVQQSTTGEGGGLSVLATNSARLVTLSGALALAVAASLFLLYPEVGDDPLQVAEELHDTEQLSAEVVSAADRAREHFLKGRFFFNRRASGDLELAHQNFKAAVDLDPSQADYWLGLAGTTGTLSFRAEIDWQDGLSLRKQALEKALTLDPLHAEAYIRLAQLHFQIGNAELTRAYLDKALELDRENQVVMSIAAGIAYFEQRLDEAVDLQRRAVELDPLGFVGRGNLATYLFTAGRLEEAAVEYLNARELNPNHGAAFDEQLVKIRVLQLRFSEAEQIVLRMPEGAYRDHGLVLLHLAREQEDRAGVLLEKMQGHDEFDHAMELADIYAFSGDVDASFHWLHVATEAIFDTDGTPANQFVLLRLQTSPFLEPLQDDPRWAEWLAETRKRVAEQQI